ncbi:MAG TPA: hypothetical protein VFH44_02730 [Solirubrobacterales bacterium]|nr:hypothetical protein [Solirubrobacterales bacterium]
MLRAAYPRAIALIQHAFARRGRGYDPAVFLFFSNRLGCFGSIVVSVIATIVLLLILGVIGGDAR